MRTLLISILLASTTFAGDFNGVAEVQKKKCTIFGNLKIKTDIEGFSKKNLKLKSKMGMKCKDLKAIVPPAFTYSANTATKLVHTYMTNDDSRGEMDYCRVTQVSTINVVTDIIVNDKAMEFKASKSKYVRTYPGMCDE